MNPVTRSGLKHSVRQMARLAAVVASGLSGLVLAQSATIYGSIGNFDVVNNTGQDACGFEVELSGISSTNIFSTFNMHRYGAATIENTATGARVRWQRLDCSSKTVAHAPGTGFIGTCYSWNTATYPTSGCEHFGVHHNGSPSNVVSRWLVPNAANNGLVPHDPPMAIAFPVYTWIPPVQVGNPPVVVAQVEAPEPPEVPERFGNPQWMKVFVRQMPRVVTLDELITENPLVVPMDPAQIEVQWDVIQADPVSGGNGRQRRNRKTNSGNLDPTTRAVVRRYELYAYTGAVDPITNEVQCADLTCTAPAANELGDFISAQMTAVEVQGDNLTVAKAGTGSGTVDSSDKRIACGNKCVGAYNAGQVVGLTAKASSNSTFVGWTGACSGTGTTCNPSVNGAVAVGAVFNLTPSGGGGGGGGGGTASYTLSIGRSNSGTVTATPTGSDRALNCGNACSAKFASGTVVTLTATPPSGKTFVNWTGACSGVASTCTVTMSNNLSVQAVFSK